MNHKISNATLYIVEIPHLVQLATVSCGTAMSHGNVTSHGMSHFVEMPCLVSWKLFPHDIWAFNMQNMACCYACPCVEK